jgi:hypothetical protein
MSGFAGPGRNGAVLTEAEISAAGDARYPVKALLRGYIDGLTLSTPGSSGNFTVQPGVTIDSTNAEIMSLAAAITKTTAAWAAGSGNGGLDTGAIAINTWYHVHLIEKTDKSAVDATFSLSPTAPTLQAGWTYARRIGSMRTNASSQWIAFIQNGDDFFWSVPVGDLTGITCHTTGILRALMVPLGIKTKMIGSIYTSGIDVNIFVSSPDMADTAANNAVGWYRNGAVQVVQMPGIPVWTNTSSQVRFRTDASSGSYGWNTWGWVDPRGKNS